MNFIVAIYSAILFFILSPGILLCLPSRSSSKYTIAIIHAIIFGIIIYFTQMLVWQMTTVVEGRKSSHTGRA
jgi:DMSO reductase anchor subunit